MFVILGDIKQINDPTFLLISIIALASKWFVA